jgi:hypothetical protein
MAQVPRSLMTIITRNLGPKTELKIVSKGSPMKQCRKHKLSNECQMAINVVCALISAVVIFTLAVSYHICCGYRLQWLWRHGGGSLAFTCGYCKLGTPSRLVSQFKVRNHHVTFLMTRHSENSNV